MSPRPRFANPHLLLQQSEAVSREDLYREDENEFSEDLVKVEQLNLLVEQTLPSLKHYVDHGGDVESSRKRKRRKLEEICDDEHTTEGDTMLFRLISSTLPPLPVCLLPPPPPPPVTREPDVEDTEMRGSLRKQQADAAAINGEIILQAAGVFQGIRPPGTVMAVRGVVPTPDPMLMVVEMLQMPRKSRPPVPSADLVYFPYSSDPSAVHPIRSKTKASLCPVVPVAAQPTHTPSDPDLNRLTVHQTRRRRKPKAKAKPRPPAQFWRPEPSWTGPCRGYAYGYPSYLAVGEGVRRAENWQYQRDKIKGATVDGR